MSTDSTAATVGTTTTTTYVNRSTISIYVPIDPNPNQTPLHTSDYIDSDDEDLFNSVLDRISNQQHEQHQSSHSSPTSKSFIDSLPIVKITGSLLNSCSRSCSICKDDFVVNEDVNSLPCIHMFHHDCIVPWLERSNSCPLCRYKLPVEQRPRRLMRCVVTSGNSNMEGWSGDIESVFGFQMIRLPLSFPLSSSSSTRIGQAATTASAGPANSEDTAWSPLVEREVHVDGAASGLDNEGVNAMVDEDGDTLMHDAYED